MKRNKENDLRFLGRAFVENLEILDGEYGGIGLDMKRPFGNSDVEADMLELLEWEMEGNDGEGPCFSLEQRNYVRQLYFMDLIPWLQNNFLGGF